MIVQIVYKNCTIAMRVVVWLAWFRVVDANGRVLAVCETRDEADAYIAGQPSVFSSLAKNGHQE